MDRKDDPNYTRFCQKCQQLVERCNFSDTQGICVICIRRYSDERQKAIQVNEAKELMDRLAEVTDGRTGQSVRLEDILDAIYDKFDGPNGFANKVFAHMEIAMQDKPGSQYVLKAFVDIMRLTNASNKLQHEREASEMTDEQLRHETEVEAMRVLLAAENHKYALALKAMEIVGGQPLNVKPEQGQGLTIPQFLDVAVAHDAANT